MHVQHDLSLTVIALIIIYLIGDFVTAADSMQVAFYIILIARKCKRHTNNQHRENLSVRAERASLENIRIYMFQNSYFFQCLSWY